MAKKKVTSRELRQIEQLVKCFELRKADFERFLEQIKGWVLSSSSLADHIHSVRGRVKNPDSLKDKLERKILKAKESGGEFDITQENLFTRINDLVGFRILHLHTRQFEEIDRELQAVFREAEFRLIEPPTARSWDDESRDYFASIGIKTVASDKLYTSVHYVIEANSRTKYTAEIQVRTLAEELWGEVDHIFNYPHESKILACREQIKVLARVASSCSRLVDSIFLSHDDSEGN